MATKTISSAAVNLLQHACINGNLVTFPQVDYSVYSKVKPVLEALNAPWSRKQKAHVFADDVDPYALIQGVLLAGVLPDKNPLAFFPTSPEVAQQMIQKMRSLQPLFPLCRTLEPSAGEGAIAQEVVKLTNSLRDSSTGNSIPQPYLKLIELDGGRFKKLKTDGYEVEQGNFLLMYPVGQPLFDAVLMNPPFAVAGQSKAYIDHIIHAFKHWLRPGGALVAIAPAGFSFNQDKQTTEFRELVEYRGGWEFLPDAAFKSAGTMAKTVILWLKKPI